MVIRKVKVNAHFVFLFQPVKLCCLGTSLSLLSMSDVTHAKMALECPETSLRTKEGITLGQNVYIFNRQRKLS